MTVETIATLEQLEQLPENTQVFIAGERGQWTKVAPDRWDKNGYRIPTRHFGPLVSAGRVRQGSGNPVPGDCYESGTNRYLILRPHPRNTTTHVDVALYSSRGTGANRRWIWQYVTQHSMNAFQTLQKVDHDAGPAIRYLNNIEEPGANDPF